MKVFKYIFKQKLLISITIILLLVESLCTFSTPFISSLIIDYGVQQNGIVFAVPLQLDPYSFRASERCLDSNEDKQLMINSYDVKYIDHPLYEGDEERFYYEININGIFNILKIEKLWIPICAYAAEVENPDYNINTLGTPDITDVDQNFLDYIKKDIKRVTGNKSYDEMYKTAIDEKMIENSFMGMNKNTYQITFLNVVTALMVFVIFIYLIVTIIGTYLASRISFTISKDLRRKQFEKVMTFSSHDMDKFSRASLITRATNDLQIVQNTSVFVIRAILIAPVMLVIGLTMAIATAPSLVWLVGVAIGLVLIVAMILITIVMPKYKIIQKMVDRINSLARENISGVSIIRALNNEQYQEERFTEANKKLYKTMLFATSLLVLAMPLLMLVINFLTLSILWAGSFQLQAGVVNIGQLIAFITYSSETIFAFMFIAAGFVMIPRADVSIGRIEEVLKHKLMINNFGKSKKDDIKKSDSSEFIKFKNVDFKYAGSSKKILDKINIDIKKNSINAIVGPTGCGKSTILKLLLRYYDVNSGSVSINGVNVKDFSEEELRNTISYVPQKAILFEGTLAENTALNPKVKDKKKIEKWLRFSNLGPFVDSHKSGIKYKIVQGALNLSGGQKQRLSIARALAEEEPILILDDPFSALDANTEKTINEGLQKELKNTTILVVTQRLSSVVDYDNIIFLDNGKVSASGTHKELLKKSKKYKNAFNKAKSPTIEEVR